MTPAKRWLSVYFAAVAAVFLASARDPQGLPKAARLADDARRLAARNEALQLEIGRLRREARALSGDPAALERAAREELGYVRPGEIIFQLDAHRGRP